MMKFLVILGLLAQANGHGQLISPVPRRDAGGQEVGYRQREPVYTINGPAGAYSRNAMRCHDATMPGRLTTITAGQTLPLQVSLPAAHPGDCYLYVSYSCEGKPLDQPCDPTSFFKIASFPGCGAAPGTTSPPNEGTLQALIPANLPACEHCVIRWEWTGHQQVTNIEFYVQCAEVKIVSNAPPTRPNPMVQISGIEHLPSQASQYRQVYAGQYPDAKYLVGPAQATYSACAAGSAGCVGSGSGGAPIPSPVASPVSSPVAAPVTAPTPAVVNCPNKVWNQCGGKNFGRATCCPAGTYCNRQDEWYSQCIPSNGQYGDGDTTTSNQAGGLSTPASVGVGVGVVGAVVGAALGFTMWKKRQQQHSFQTQPVTVVSQQNPMYV